MNAKRAALFIYGKLEKEIYSQIWGIEKFCPREKFDRNQAEELKESLVGAQILMELSKNNLRFTVGKKAVHYIFI